MEVTESREALVGRMTVRRALPLRGRRTVGAWCFADHLGPVDLTEGPDVGPHPHIGLHTVTWLVEGQALHLDSLGTEQVITPGQLNLMTAGRGIAHAEESTGHYRGGLHGIQLWVAQPEQTRHGEPAFEHHAALPQAQFGGADVTVLVGELGGHRSPARHDTAIVGAELVVRAATSLPLDPTFEHALVVLDGEVAIDGSPLPPGRLGYLAPGRDVLDLDVREPARVMLLGGEPFGEQIVMWWNFVGRDRADIDSAFASWDSDDGRFAPVRSRLPRIPVAAPLWTPST